MQCCFNDHKDYFELFRIPHVSIYENRSPLAHFSIVPFLDPSEFLPQSFHSNTLTFWAASKIFQWNATVRQLQKLIFLHLIRELFCKDFSYFILQYLNLYQDKYSYIYFSKFSFSEPRNFLYFSDNFFSKTQFIKTNCVSCMSAKISPSLRHEIIPKSEITLQHIFHHQIMLATSFSVSE